MATLTYEQIKQVAAAGGLPGDKDMWAAVAMAESSGSTTVVNSIGCVGLWQINQPVHIRSHPQWTVAWLQNPVNNAKAAAVIYRAQGMNAWEAYTGPSGRGSSGPWRQYYKGAGGANKAAVTQANWWDDFKKGFSDGFDTGPGPEDLWDGGTENDPSLGDIGGDLGITQVASAIGGIAEAVQKAAQWMGNAQNWVRVGYVAGGGVLVALGLSIVAKPLLNAAPMGKVASVAKSAGTAAKNTAKKTAAKAKAAKGEGS